MLGSHTWPEGTLKQKSNVFPTPKKTMIQHCIVAEVYIMMMSQA